MSPPVSKCSKRNGSTVSIMSAGLQCSVVSKLKHTVTVRHHMAVVSMAFSVRSIFLLMDIG